MIGFEDLGLHHSYSASQFSNSLRNVINNELSNHKDLELPDPEFWRSVVITIGVRKSALWITDGDSLKAGQSLDNFVVLVSTAMKAWRGTKTAWKHQCFQAFGAFCPCRSWPTSEHTPLKNTVWKTPFVTLWLMVRLEDKEHGWLEFKTKRVLGLLHGEYTWPWNGSMRTKAASPSSSRPLVRPDNVP